jgi:signal peptidase II
MLITLAITVPLDFVSKRWVEAAIPFGERLSVVEGFLYLTHVRNPGAAFGLFVDAPASWRLVLFSIVSALALVMIVSFFRRLAPGDRRTSGALALILGGAAGNFLDRVMRDEVVDFLHIRLWGGFVWPDFNFADIFIVVGVLGLVLDLMVSEAAARATDEEFASVDDKK